MSTTPSDDDARLVSPVAEDQHQRAIKQADLFQRAATKVAAEEKTRTELRAAYDRHMAWHPTFNAHDLSRFQLHVEGAESDCTVAALTSPAARRILKQTARQLAAVPRSTKCVAERRKISSAALARIVKRSTSRSLVRRLLAWLLPASA